MKLNSLFEGFSKQIYSKPNESSDDDSALAAKTTNRLAKWENEKYRMLLDDSIVWKGHTLYRVQYKKDIILDDYYFARKDFLGGYIESLDNLSENGSCVVLDYAKVWGNAKVCENAEVFGDAWIWMSAQVYGNAKIYDNAQVYGDAEVGGDAEVWRNAQIYDNAQVYGLAQIYDNAQVYGLAQIYDNAQVYWDAQIHGGVKVYDNAQVYGDSEIFGNDVHINHFMMICNKRIF